MTGSDDEAQFIYQTSLDECGEAVAKRDFATYAPFILLPHLLVIDKSSMMISTRQQLHNFFADLCARLDCKDVPDLTRLCTSAEFIEPDVILGHHNTWLMTPRNQIVDSYVGSITMRRVDGTWYVVRSAFHNRGVRMPLEDLAQSAAEQSGPDGPQTDRSGPHTT